MNYCVPCAKKHNLKLDISTFHAGICSHCLAVRVVGKEVKHAVK